LQAEGHRFDPDILHETHMAKGLFTQGAAVLFSSSPTLDELEDLLREFSVPKRDDKGTEPDLSGPSLVVTYRPQVNGYVTVDVQARQWPDHMGDPAKEPMLFGAWSMGHFGPFAYPGGLQRAGEQSWSWVEGASIPAAHRAFVRIRLSYLFGADDNARVMPEDCDAAAELQFVTSIGRALLDHPAALAHFNPSGELLCNRTMMDQRLKSSRTSELPALDLWSNIRLFNAGDGWMSMDSVGMLQLDLPDNEACFLRDDYEPSDIANFLRNVSMYLLNEGDVIKHGDTSFGPGDVNWRAMRVEDGLVEPPRPVLRWFPNDGSTPPDALVRTDRAH
jgi:hypothetical protein